MNKKPMGIDEAKEIVKAVVEECRYDFWWLKQVRVACSLLLATIDKQWSLIKELKKDVKDTENARCKGYDRLVAELQNLKQEITYHNEWAKDIAKELCCADAMTYRNDAIDCIRSLKQGKEVGILEVAEKAFEKVGDYERCLDIAIALLKHYRITQRGK